MGWKILARSRRQGETKMITLGIFLGWILADSLSWFQYREAKKTINSWMPEVIPGVVSYIDVSGLTAAQVHVLLEHIKGEK